MIQVERRADSPFGLPRTDNASYLWIQDLVILDILTRPAPQLTTAERDEVKKVASELLIKLKGLLVLDWRQKVTARSKI